MRTQPTKSPSESCVGCQESPRSTQSKQLAFAVSAISALNESLACSSAAFDPSSASSAASAELEKRDDRAARETAGVKGAIMSTITVGKENSTSDRPLLRRPWVGLAGRADSRLAAERRVVGEADGRAPRRRASRDHLRPPRLRPLEQAWRRLQLRHVRRRSRQGAEEARPQESRAGRVLDGLGRGHADTSGNTAASACARPC